jgi:hypothetical protein
MHPLPRGAYPDAGLQLLEVHRAHIRDVHTTTRARLDDAGCDRRERRAYLFEQALEEYFAEPLALPCLSRVNWTAGRPRLFTSTHVTTRDSLVLEVRPMRRAEFFWQQDVPVADTGDFRSFDIETPPFGRPSNRVLHLCPGVELARKLAPNPPWLIRGAVEQFALDRHLCMLALKAKLHQLSLYFDCYPVQWLVEFDEHHLLDFRDASALADGRTPLASDYFDADRWAPPRWQELLEDGATGLDFPRLYAFARLYLVDVAEEKRRPVLIEYLASAHANRVTDADVAELMRYSVPRARLDGWLQSMAADAVGFEAAARESPGWAAVFARSLGLDEDAALWWACQHHPAALSTIPVPDRWLKSSLEQWVAGRGGSRALHATLDARLASQVALRCEQAVSRAELNQAARALGHDSFKALHVWSTRCAPLTRVRLHEAAQRVDRALAAARAAKSAGQPGDKSR